MAADHPVRAVCCSRRLGVYVGVQARYAPIGSPEIFTVQIDGLPEEIAPPLAPAPKERRRADERSDAVEPTDAAASGVGTSLVQQEDQGEQEEVLRSLAGAHEDETADESAAALDALADADKRKKG